MTRIPRLAVLLPVHNGQAYIAEAIRSVLDQTFHDFTLVVIDDASTDRTPEILAGFPDPRLRVLRLPAHQGLVAALNAGIRESKSELIARMDADDICLPHRFERQIAFLDQHADVAVCGTWAREFGDRGNVHRLPAGPEQIRARLFFGWAMDHPTLLMRRAFLERHGLAYSEEFPHAEDFHFLVRAAELAPLANLPEVLLLYRVHRRQQSATYQQEQIRAEALLSARQLRQLLPEVTKEEEDFHIRLIRGEMAAASLAQAEQWLLRLDQRNCQSARYEAGAFQSELRRKWYQCHALASSAGLRVLASYWKSPLASLRDVRLRNHAGLIARCLIRRPDWRRQCRQFAGRMGAGR